MGNTGTQDQPIPTGVVPPAGDLGGTVDDPLVTGLQGNPVSNAAPADDDVLEWNGSEWVPTAGGGGGPGPQGPQGAQGAPGAQGATGAGGAAGAQGAQGAVGPGGATGAQGAAGANGAQGAQGAVGPGGAQGAVGPAGPTGAQGAAGGGLPSAPLTGYAGAPVTAPANTETSVASLSGLTLAAGDTFIAEAWTLHSSAVGCTVRVRVGTATLTGTVVQTITLGDETGSSAQYYWRAMVIIGAIGASEPVNCSALGLPVTSTSETFPTFSEGPGTTPVDVNTSTADFIELTVQTPSSGGTLKLVAAAIYEIV